MAITVKLSTLVESTPARQRIGQTRGFSIKTSYTLGRILDKINQEMRDFERAHHKLVMELGAAVTTITPDGKEIPTAEFRVLPENLAEFQRQFDELMALNVTITRDPIKLTDLGDKVDIAPGDLAACSYLFVE